MEDQVLGKNAVVTISFQRTTFRFEGLARNEFDTLLGVFRSHFPHMEWDHTKKAWTLPTMQFQSLYELCRAQFGPTGIRVVVDDYRAKRPELQPTYWGPLFDN